MLLVLRDDENLYMNGVKVGEVYKEVDGYYVFTPVRGGYWKSHNLREVADFLDNLNAEWDAEVQAYFNRRGD